MSRQTVRFGITCFEQGVDINSGTTSTKKLLLKWSTESILQSLLSKKLPSAELTTVSSWFVAITCPPLLFHHDANEEGKKFINMKSRKVYRSISAMNTGRRDDGRPRT